MANVIRRSGFNLRDYTPARVSLPTTGHSLATGEVLSFQLAHAQARDAVRAQLDLASFALRLRDDRCPSPIVVCCEAEAKGARWSVAEAML